MDGQQTSVRQRGRRKRKPSGGRRKRVTKKQRLADPIKHTRSSAETWSLLWSEAILELSLDEEYFFSLTPRQFYALRERKKRINEHNELLFGILASTVANFSMAAPKKALKPFDFMPTREAEKQKSKADNKVIASGKKFTMTKKSREQLGNDLFAMGRSNCGFFQVVVPKEQDGGQD